MLNVAVWNAASLDKPKYWKKEKSFHINSGEKKNNQKKGLNTKKVGLLFSDRLQLHPLRIYTDFGDCAHSTQFMIALDIY